MKKIKIFFRSAAVILSTLFLLVSCEDIKEFFNDMPNWGSASVSNRAYNPKYDSQSGNYSGKQTAMPSNDPPLANETGAATTTVSAPISSPEKPVNSTVDSPAVPSVAPTVDQ